MATTVNGWTVIQSNRTNGPLPRLRKWQLPGAENDRHFYLRDGACGFVLMHMILWFHEEIERLDTGVWDEWGWAVRPVRGQTTGFSNHAGGVAADLNATHHPIGVDVDRTFTLKQQRRIRRRLKLYCGLLIWGGDWSRPDGMHFEIDRANLASVEHLARDLMDTARGRRILEANRGARKVILS